MSFELKRQLMQLAFVAGYSLAILVDNLWVQVPSLALGIWVTFQYGRAWERVGREH